MKKRDSVSIAPRFGFLYRIGRCPKCMRESFLFAAASLSLWTASLAADAAYGNAFRILSVASHLLAALSSAAILLWLLHLGIYAFRSVYGDGLAAPFTAGPQEGANSNQLVAAGRRHALQTLVKAFLGAAAATVLPSMALASGECPGKLNCGWSSCTPQNSTAYCCPKGYPILSLCDCNCYTSVQGMRCNQTGSCFSENF
ncbi:hypothetical protein [Mesorhizobium sp. M1163]|uniref:hypothetical protein n=1 Tax=Mesorhizobium sp. M1163 TaxID=2957065 RepID=UPI00333CDE18